MLPVAPRSPVLLETSLCGPGFLKLHFSLQFGKKQLPVPRVYQQPRLRERSKLRMGLVLLLVAEGVTSEPLSCLFQSLHLENKKINIQLERFNLLTRSREAVGTIKCHAKLIMPAPGTMHGMQ